MSPKNVMTTNYDEGDGLPEKTRPGLKNACETINEDPFELARFVLAQEPVYSTVLAELRSGHKHSHWMWFIFPQVVGLGLSAMSQRYAIQSLDEAQAYLAHPVLGARLQECAEMVLSVRGRSASEIFGNPDDVKLQSSMTLFALAEGEQSVFSRVLETYFGARRDEGTLQRVE